MVARAEARRSWMEIGAALLPGFMSGTCTIGWEADSNVQLRKSGFDIVNKPVRLLYQVDVT